MRWLGLLVLWCAAACRTSFGELDGAYYSWDDRTVHCAIEIDDHAGYSPADIEEGLDRVKLTGEVLEVLVHRPGHTMTWEHFEALLRGTRDRGLPFLTATDMANGPPRAGVAIEYDDAWLDWWVASQDLLAQYDARVTMFVSRYIGLPDYARQQLRDLHAAGHDIEAHSVQHLRGPTFVEEHGLQAYIDQEVVPSIDVLRADGYDVLSFAYPFGMRTAEIDAAILATQRVKTVRALIKSNELRADPCPN